MGHFDNILCRYKRYYFGKTLKCEIKSYSLGWPKYSGRFSTFVHTAKVEVETPFFQIQPQAIESNGSGEIQKFSGGESVIEASLRACMS